MTAQDEISRLWVLQKWTPATIGTTTYTSTPAEEPPWWERLDIWMRSEERPDITRLLRVLNVGWFAAFLVSREAVRQLEERNMYYKLLTVSVKKMCLAVVWPRDHLEQAVSRPVLGRRKIGLPLPVLTKLAHGQDSQINLQECREFTGELPRVQANIYLIQKPYCFRNKIVGLSRTHNIIVGQVNRSSPP